MAHITGGGFYENVPRMLPEGLGAKFTAGSWEIPQVFTFLQETAGISLEEMFNVFNMGVGYMIVIDKSEKENALKLLPEGRVIGEITASGKVEL